MMLSVAHIAMPLLLITLGALVSEYAGRMALFLDGMINLGAFCCLALTVATGSVAWGTLLSCAACMAATFVLERLATKARANIFLAALAMNILFSAVTSMLSARLFGTRGVVHAEQFAFGAAAAKNVTSALCLALSAGVIAWLTRTRQGLSLRVSGSAPQVLLANGTSAERYQCVAWQITAFTGALAGCVYAIRLSSFVPGMSGGRGWTALAAVFLGRKRPAMVVLAVLAFSFAEYLATRAQGIAFLRAVPSSVLLSLPYLLALLLIAVVPGKDER